MTKEDKISGYLEKAGFFLLEVKDKQVFDLQKIFRNDNPTYLEIGCGKGEFISRYPLLYPQDNFLGFELRHKRIVSILKKLNIEQHRNVRLAEIKIDEKIDIFVATDSISGIYIQHPDPWFKRRHHKKRLISDSFLNAISRILKKGGFVQISTDHREYAEWIAAKFLERTDFRSEQNLKSGDTPFGEEHVRTWYEHEQARQGYQPIFMMFEKV